MFRIVANGYVGRWKPLNISIAKIQCLAEQMNERFNDWYIEFKGE